MSELITRPALKPDTFLALTSVAERPAALKLNEILFSGMFPRIHDRKLDPHTWLDGYV